MNLFVGVGESLRDSVYFLLIVRQGKRGCNLQPVMYVTVFTSNPASIDTS
jgi:hypothetical protein